MSDQLAGLQIDIRNKIKIPISKRLICKEDHTFLLFYGYAHFLLKFKHGLLAHSEKTA
jgi:RNase P subunit RPR2